MSLKIIVIANGPNALDYRAGDIIDSFDLVIRMNCFQTEGYEEYIGSKTDIWVTTNDFDRFISEYEGLLEKRKGERFKENWTTDPKDLETFVERNNIQCEEIHFINLWHSHTFGSILKDEIIYENRVSFDEFDSGVLVSISKDYKINYYNETQIVKARNSKNLSTGLHTLMYAISRWKGEIYIHGFDFFKSGREYFSKPENTWEMAHDAIAEEALVKAWIDKGILKKFNGEEDA